MRSSSKNFSGIAQDISITGSVQPGRAWVSGMLWSMAIPGLGAIAVGVIQQSPLSPNHLALQKSPTAQCTVNQKVFQNDFPVETQQGFPTNEYREASII